MKKIVKKQLPVAQLRALIDDSQTSEQDTRTVELTWSTGFKGLRKGWDGPYYEELSMKPEHVDLSRLQSGAPLLDSHNSGDLNKVIGVVERAWLENDKGKAIVRFSTDPEADKIYQKVKEKILRNVSVGYQVRKYEDVSQKGDKYLTYRATNWLPQEISIVPIGFDPNAQVRENENLNEVEIEIEQVTVSEIKNRNLAGENINMNEKEQKEQLEKAQQEAKLAEKTRQTEIRSAVRNAKLDESLAEEMIRNDISADEARKTVLSELAKRDEKAAVNPSVRVEVSDDNQTKRREIFETAVLAKFNGDNFKHDNDSRLLQGYNSLRMIETLVPRHTMESDVAYAKRAMVSADLPLALANIAEKSLQKPYQLAPKTFEAWTNKGTLRNFKEASQVKVGDYSSLAERAENADYTEGTFSEKNEVAQLKEHGKIHSFSSQMLVNDDLGAIARVMSGSGNAIARLENKLAYDALTTNKDMQDGVALYHATHGNLGTAGDLTMASVSEAYKLMRKQKTTDGLDYLNLAPMFLVCGPDMEMKALQFFSPINPEQTSSVNIYAGRVKVIVDANIVGDDYYFIADPTSIDTVTCYRLEGQEQPKVTSRVKFENSSLQIKIEHSFAAAPMDWRGIVKNTGAT